MVSRIWPSKHQQKVTLEDSLLVDLLADTLLELEEPDDIVHWILHKRKGAKRQEAQTFAYRAFLCRGKHKLMKMSKQLRQSSLTLDNWLTELQQQ